MSSGNPLSRRAFLQASAATLVAAGATGHTAAEEKTMRIIDPHVHVWKNDPKYPWPKEEKEPPKADALPETLLDLMKANGVEKTVLVQATARSVSVKLSVRSVARRLSGPTDPECRAGNQGPCPSWGVAGLARAAAFVLPPHRDDDLLALRRG